MGAQNGIPVTRASPPRWDRKLQGHFGAQLRQRAMRASILVCLLVSACTSFRSQPASPSADHRTPEQLNAFLRSHEREIAAGDRATVRRLDALCGQHDCRSSRLFWYTDLEAAKAQARREHKPILSLRLLGKLTDEQSCANSRFFRSVLYADPMVAALLRDHFVLHWKEVRPVPKVTIDFGDGRRITRTLTGNSVHYVLDADGHPLDALPGLFSPRAFANALQEDAKLAAQLASSATRDADLATWHEHQLSSLVNTWTHLLRTRGVTPTPQLPPDAQSAIAMLNETSRGVGYERLASTAELSAPVQARIEQGLPAAWKANDLAPTKAILESPVLRAVREIGYTIGRDSIENELWNRGRVHTWFAHKEVGLEPIALDYRVYSELFLSPLDDPWYGLMPSEEMRALDDCAVTETGHNRL
jgi:hypothetical protein